MAEPPNALDDVAVVIPLYNGAPWIGATLGAVRAQTHAPGEIVVVDNNSTDDGPEIAAAVPGVRVVRCAEPGTDSARQAGIAETTASFVALLDQDDLWHPDHLRLLATALAQHPDTAAAVGMTGSFADGTVPAFDVPTLDLEVVDPWDVYPGCFTPTPSGALLRRTALDEVGGWASGYLGATDTYMWLRLSTFRPFVRNRCTLAAHRRHRTSHNERLRAEQASLYMANVVQAAVDVAHYREAHHPNERAALEGLRQLALAAEGLRDAMQRRDGPALALAAQRMEVAAAGCTDRQVNEAVGLVMWILAPMREGPAGYDATWRLLVRHWPRAARRTGRERFYMTSVRPALACLRRAPAEAWRWRLVSRLLALRLRQAMA